MRELFVFLTCRGHLQAAGWIIVLCFGALFALLAVLLVWIDVTFSGAVYNSEQVCTISSFVDGLVCVNVHPEVFWLR